jgi:uncharacterized protein YcbX
MGEQVGVVSELWRYPVQSLRGESLTALDFTAHGIVGDRGYCVAEAATGAAGTAARPPWKMLVTWSARYVREPLAGEDLPPVEIAFPDGATILSDDARIHDALSERIGRAVRLARSDAPDITLPYEVSHCHLLTGATLQALSAAYPQGRFVPERFRPNVVLDCGAVTGFIESAWLGSDLTLGAVTLDINEHCERCALTTRPQGDLPMDPGILHTAQQFNQNHVGVYGAVRQAGRLSLGDVARR